MHDNTMKVLITATIMIGLVVLIGLFTGYKSDVKFADKGYVQRVVSSGTLICDRIIWVKGE